jgi:hypothetical protein
MLTPEACRGWFAKALPFDLYLQTARPHERTGWTAFADKVVLTPAQAATARGIERRVNILVMSGTWCGDCVQQVPILAKIEAAQPAPRGEPDAPGIDLRILDRDEHPDLAGCVRICGGNRVPVMIFLSEEFDFVSLSGDRTLSRYRAMLRRHMGPACQLPGAPVDSDELGSTVQDWMNEVERVAIMLRLSGKLRQKHGD